MYNFCQVRSYVHNYSNGSRAIDISRNGVPVNLYLFYPDEDGSGKIDSIAIYGSYLQGFYNSIQSEKMIFGLKVKAIYKDSGIEDFLDVYLDYMMTKKDIQRIGNEYGLSLLPDMIRHKSYLQKAVLSALSTKELLNIKNSIYDDGVTQKLIDLAAEEYRKNKTEKTLYALAMSIGTILKEYEWGIEHVLSDGLCKIANRIELKL